MYVYKYVCEECVLNLLGTQTLQVFINQNFQKIIKYSALGSSTRGHVTFLHTRKWQ